MISSSKRQRRQRFVVKCSSSEPRSGQKMLGLLPSPLQILFEVQVNLYSKSGSKGLNQQYPQKEGGPLTFMMALFQSTSCWRSKSSLKMGKTSSIKKPSLASTLSISKKYLGPLDPLDAACLQNVLYLL